MFSILNNIPTVTRNLLIINILMFVLTFFFQAQGIELRAILASHYVSSPLFEPYQIVSHFFMHEDILHILFNMLGVVMLGGFLERLWGPKRYFIFYISCALGAFALYNGIGVYQMIESKNALKSSMIDLTVIDNIIKTSANDYEITKNVNEYIESLHLSPTFDFTPLQTYYDVATGRMLGASGAVFGILVAFAILFPNTEFLLYFAIPVKAKYLALGYVAYELYNAYYPSDGDHVAHLAHIGGAIVGTVLVLIWRKNRTQFY